ncbi:MAG: tRNA (adenosine(37)-N6)-threonylcarbamoyltransferase complex dimerization subunit type 1 TsaB [Actinomycetota bacterium]|nr:tRNA (adenosine(37)-N6)-threonylcarbamoyltransferase complex dimerization subunit type 1 TsaB [Actinomycetota bacterium]MDK1016253.1 tRNA (adenosine(37)-N6)-threonylcarbamoyltransferase complex dimerization subunit type 1 TsaB [Actinomycetota bacterium]MDK1026009.1 tRNA (adenosine(37)-N6)-threonylcarbamoyltransferase complex dimerization subunit type 1 TsaB [Actinomycetota bacterium]MDK1037879.1 tRNA (adenosine(37)-N6)-threonylcarbamoyltransferase complex dimerization subunit type 1 TsaB [Act
MKILAIDTATPASSVAIGDDDAVRGLSVNVDRRGHVKFLVPAIDFCLSQAGWNSRDIELVAVDVGPGPYTGLRSGIATAQAFAAAIGAPMATVSSLTTIALRAATGHRRIWPVVDMRRGQIAVAPFTPLPGGVAPDGDPEVVRPEDFKAMLEAEAVESLVVGDWQSVPDSTWTGLQNVKRGMPRYPSAETILEIAAMKARHGKTLGPEDVRPTYMRDPDVQINWKAFRSEGAWPQ